MGGGVVLLVIGNNATLVVLKGRTVGKQRARNRSSVVDLIHHFCFTIQGAILRYICLACIHKSTGTVAVALPTHGVLQWQFTPGAEDHSLIWHARLVRYPIFVNELVRQGVVPSSAAAEALHRTGVEEHLGREADHRFQSLGRNDEAIRESAHDGVRPARPTRRRQKLVCNWGDEHHSVYVSPVKIGW